MGLRDKVVASWVIAAGSGKHVKIPNADRAVVPPIKLLGYVLSHWHPKGRGKLKGLALQGYTRYNFRVLERDLKKHVKNDAIEGPVTPFGHTYSVEANLTGPNGRTMNIVSVWIIETGTDVPRFVTLHLEDPPS